VCVVHMRKNLTSCSKSANKPSTSGRCENPECRNITEYGGISRNMAEYHGICRNIPEYHGISRHFPGIYRNITIFSDGSHATVYKHGRLTTYFITKVMDLSHFDGK
jgi:hypothetical protein